MCRTLTCRSDYSKKLPLRAFFRTFVNELVTDFFLKIIEPQSKIFQTCRMNGSKSVCKLIQGVPSSKGKAFSWKQTKR